MIFRGDGKNHIVEGSSFKKFLRRSVSNNDVATATYHNSEAAKGEEPVTKVFMNPPFALKKTEHEWEFVKAAMKSVEDGGMIFVIVPMSVVTEGGVTGHWRKTLLTHHTLWAVVSFPEELFYPVANQTVGVILQKGVPHPANQPVFWGRIVNDGFRKSKGKRLPINSQSPTDIDRIRPKLQAFLRDPTQPVDDVPEFTVAALIETSDPILEFAPEAYLTSHTPTLAELLARLDRQVREDVGAIVQLDLQYKIDGRPSILDAARSASLGTPGILPKLPRMKPVRLDELFTLHPGDFHSMADEDAGNVPVASCADFGNGIVGTYDVESGVVYRDAITIAFNGSPLTTKLHPYPFAAKDDVAVAIPLNTMSPEAMIFIQAQLNAERWRFSYYRKCFRAKLGRLTVELPMKNGEVDFDFMEAAVRVQPYWWFLAPRLQNWSPTASPNTLVAKKEKEDGRETTGPAV